MANYPQLDNASGVWNLREVYDAVMGGYWPNHGAIALTNKSDASTKTVALPVVDIVIFSINAPPLLP